MTGSPPRRRGAAAVALLLTSLGLGALLLGACGGGTGTASTSGTGVPDDLGDVVDLTGKPEITIEVPDNTFKPKLVKVSPSTKVVFSDTGANAHNVTPNDDGTWDPLALKSGESKTLVAPAKAGTYRYYCTIHGGKTSGQRGAIVVVPPA